MAMQSDIDAPLTLEMSGDDVTPAAFMRAVRSFFAAVKSLTDEIDSDLHWRVQVKQGSNLISTIPTGKYNVVSVSDIVSSFDRGFEVIERSGQGVGDFPEKALKSIRDMASVAVAADGDMLVRLWTGKRPHNLSARTIAAIDDILTGAFTEQGSVCGTIETISQRGGARFVIYENRNPKAINCIVPAEKLADAIAAFGKRAEVYGKVHYDKHGRATRVNVEDIDIFPDNSDLPNFKDVKGILGRIAH